MTAATPDDMDRDPLEESGEYPLGAEATPSPAAVEAMQAAADAAQNTEIRDATNNGETAGLSEKDFTAESDMSKDVAEAIRLALKKQVTPRKDLFSGKDDPHLSDAKRIAASFGEMAVGGTENIEGDEDVETTGNGEVPAIAGAVAEPRAQKTRNTETNRPITDVTAQSLAPAFLFGKSKKPAQE
jgi:hypothetical protein